MSEDAPYVFRPRARLLQLLGDQLIGSSRLAIFELVKNAYDADADRVTVTIENLGTQDTVITAVDDGDGMSLKTIKEIWLVPADDHRVKQRSSGKRTKKGRLPLGEKGLGRFAVHKLGDSIEVVTKAVRHQECVITIDWKKFLKNKFLADAVVDVVERAPEVFIDGKTGTQISISDLRGEEWTRGEVRRLYRQIVSMASPFDLDDLTESEITFPVEDFVAELSIPGYEEWIEDIPDVQDILDLAFWHFRFRIEDGLINWRYHLRRIPELNLEERLLYGQEEPFEVPTHFHLDQFDEEKPINDPLLASAEMQETIGPIWGEFFVFDRDRRVQQYVPRIAKAANYLDSNGGVRVYRDGIRVYNYGELGDDWLGLDLWRLNEPSKRVSKNIVIGAVNILLESSLGLVEKSSRDGFDESRPYKNFQALTFGALNTFLPERSKDKDRIRQYTEKEADPETLKIKAPLLEIRKIAERHKVLPQLEKYISKIEIDYDEMRRTMLQIGMSNLSLALVFHEVVRGVNALAQSANSGASITDLQEQATNLNELLSDVTDLLRTDTPKKQSIARVIKQANRFYKGRINYHKISLEAPVLDGGSDDSEAYFSFGMVLNSVTNALDNSIHWLKMRWPSNGASETSNRKIYAGISHDLGDGPAIVIADNGTGFNAEDTPEDLVRAFFSRKLQEDNKRGTGLGLYYTNIALELNEAKLLFTDAKTAGIPPEFDGAVIAFLFEKHR